MKQKYKSISVPNNIIDKLNSVENFADDYEDNNKLNDIVVKLIKKLPRAQRRVMELRLIEKRSIRNITKVLKKNLNYVKVTQSRATKRLKKLMEQKDFVNS